MTDEKEDDEALGVMVGDDTVCDEEARVIGLSRVSGDNGAFSSRAESLFVVVAAIPWSCNDRTRSAIDLRTGPSFSSRGDPL